MEIRQLKTFLVVADLLSFNGAADQLHIAQSTVSARILSLEQEVGVPLFDRLGKKIALTEAGRIMVRYARKMADLETETLSEVAGWEEPGGSISVRMPQSLARHILPRALKDFQARFPRVTLDINSCTFSRLKHELRSGITDVAFLLFEDVHESDLKSRVLGFTTLVFICAADSPLGGQNGVSMEALEGQTLILPKYDCRDKNMLSQTLVRRKISPLSTMEINSIDTIKACVARGVGVSLLPEFIVEKELNRGEISSFYIENEPMETAILMVLHKDKWLSQSMEFFLSRVTACFHPD